MKTINSIFTILHKDLLLELRDKQVIVSMLVFALIVVVVFNFMFDPGTDYIRLILPGLLWVVIIFAGSLGFARSFAREQENGRMHGLVLCPIEKSYIYIAKLLGNILFLLIVEMITLPILVVLYDISFSSSWLPLAAVLFLGTVGFASVGTLFSAISANMRSSEVMLPILLFPVVVPVILTATKSTSALLQGGDFQQIWGWLRLLLGFDIIFLVICFLLYDYVLEE
jgi:heme exporter protein B